MYYFVYTHTEASGGVAKSTKERSVDIDELLRVGSPAGQRLLCMVTEVHNTPWGQTCLYVHPWDMFRHGDTRQGPCREAVTAQQALALHTATGGTMWTGRQAFQHLFPKTMHVSPFLDMHYSYHLNCKAITSDSWYVRWTLYRQKEEEDNVGHGDVEDGKTVPSAPQADDSSALCEVTQPPTLTRFPTPHFVASMSLTGEDVSQKTLFRVLWDCPAHNFMVIWGIYWRAAWLLLKGVTFYAHPDTAATTPGGEEEAQATGTAVQHATEAGP